MIWLGLFYSVISVPGFTSATIPAGWAALSATLPIAAWRPGRLAWPHAAFALFLAYAALSILWSTSHLSGVYRLWQLTLVAGAFWLGSSLPPLRLLIGLGLGGAASSALAIGQWYGIETVIRYGVGHYAGLHFNGVFSGMIAALLIVALSCERVWWLALAQVPALLLSGSRGALLATGFGLVCLWFRRPTGLVIACVAVLFYIGLKLTPSDADRVNIFTVAAAGITPFGWGAGSFADLFFAINGRLFQPEHVHNDALHLAFEFGLGAAPILLLWAALAADTRARYWPVHACFLLLTCFTFPLFTPIPALVWALCAGATVRDWASPSDLLRRSGCWTTVRSSLEPVPVSLSPERLK